MSGNQPMENQLQEIEQAKIQLLEIITKLQPHEPCDMSQREHMFGDCQEFTKVSGSQQKCLVANVFAFRFIWRRTKNKRQERLIANCEIIVQF